MTVCMSLCVCSGDGMWVVAARLRRAIARSDRKYEVLGDKSRCHEVIPHARTNDFRRCPTVRGIPKEGRGSPDAAGGDEVDKPTR